VVLTLQEAADRLGVHYMTVYRWVRTGRLPATKQGAAWAVREADLDELVEPKPSSRPPRVDHADRHARRLVAGDEPGAMAVAEAALAGGMDPEDLYLDVLTAAMARIGDQWTTGEVTVAQEHQATAIMLRLLGRLGRNFTRRGRSRGTIVLGAAQGDPHGLPGALLADPLRGRRFTVVDLGADCPPEAFADAALAADDLVAVGVTLTAPPLTPVQRTIAALRNADVTAPVLVGGAAFTDAATAVRLGADLWATNGREALAVLTHLVAGS
jgi:excisionase family DNA binding protein